MKVAFIDFETGSLDRRVTPVLSVSIIVDDGGVTVGKYSSLVKPYDVSLVTEKALEVNGLTLEQLEDAKCEKHVFAEMMMFLKQFVVPEHRNDRLFFCAHNAPFDDGVFRGMAYRNAGDKHIRSKYFWNQLLCTQGMASNFCCEIMHKMKSHELADFAYQVLGEECVDDIVGESGFHDADVDVALCRELFYATRGAVMVGGGNGC